MREGLKSILAEASDIQIAAEATNGDEVLALVKQGGFDLLLTDLSMPGINGIDLIRQVRQEAPKLHILVLSMFNEEQYAIRSIRAGARGYLTKESAGTQLVTAIRKVADGRLHITPEVAEQLARTINQGQKTSEHPHMQLSDREFEIFNMLVAGKSVSEIGMELSLSIKTVSTHKARIMQKMNMNSTAELVKYALSHQLIKLV